MITASWLLLSMGVLGALDLLLYHELAHGLRQRPESRTELVTHALRGLTHAALLLAIPNLDLTGTWFVALLVLVSFDFTIAIADCWLEPASRASDGGLRRGEYVLHVLLAMTFGALVYAVLDEGRHVYGLASSLAWIEVGPPAALRIVLGLLALLFFASALLDLRAVGRLRRERS